MKAYKYYTVYYYSFMGVYVVYKDSGYNLTQKYFYAYNPTLMGI